MKKKNVCGQNVGPVLEQVNFNVVVMMIDV